MTRRTEQDLEVIARGMRWQLKNGEWLINFLFADIDGRRECVGMEVRSVAAAFEIDGDGRPFIRYKKAADMEPKPLRVSDFRTFPIATMVRVMREEIRLELQAEAEVETDDVTRKALVDAERSMEVAPNTYGREHWVKVAAVYERAWLDGDHPTKAVAENFHVSRTAAAKWVARARKMHLLGDTEKRKPGGVRPEPTTSKQPPRKGR